MFSIHLFVALSLGLKTDTNREANFWHLDGAKIELITSLELQLLSSFLFYCLLQLYQTKLD